MTYARTVAEAQSELVTVGRLCGAPERAHRLAAAIGRACTQGSAPARPPRVLALVWRDPFMAVGPDTSAADLVRTSGGAVVAPTVERRYPRVSADDVAALDPEVILLPTEPYAFTEEDRAELMGEFDCPATRDARVYVIEGEILSWYGPRIPQAIHAFARTVRGWPLG